jgi:hypothetical protein
MGECKAGHYTNNEVVTHMPLVCHGGEGQPPCEYLDRCAIENGMKKRRIRKARKEKSI